MIKSSEGKRETRAAHVLGNWHLEVSEGDYPCVVLIMPAFMNRSTVQAIATQHVRNWTDATNKYASTGEWTDDRFPFDDEGADFTLVTPDGTNLEMTDTDMVPWLKNDEIAWLSDEEWDARDNEWRTLNEGK